METTNNAVQHCTQCDNNCPIDALKCGRGRRFFGIEEKIDTNSLTGLMKKCGHALHHSGGAMDEAKLFQALSEEEQNTLKTLLQKVSASWDELLGAGGEHSHERGGKHGGEHGGEREHGREHGGEHRHSQR